jgi:hypothetical protein
VTTQSNADDLKDIVRPEPPFEIVINGKRFEILEYVLTGLQLKELAKKPSTDILYYEAKSGARYIVDSEGAMLMANGLWFYTVHPNT